MEINKDYRYFKEWFQKAEKSFAHGQFTDEQIALSSFMEGMKYISTKNKESAKNIQQ